MICVCTLFTSIGSRLRTVINLYGFVASTLTSYSSGRIKLVLKPELVIVAYEVRNPCLIGSVLVQDAIEVTVRVDLGCGVELERLGVGCECPAKDKNAGVCSAGGRVIVTMEFE
jgi:hypothetical protein